MKTTDDNLAQLFRKLPAEEMPAGLRAGIMERVVAEKGRRRLSSDAIGIMVAIFASLVIIAGVVFLFKYMDLSLDIFDGSYTVVFIVALLSLAMLIAETLISQRIRMNKYLKNI